MSNLRTTTWWWNLDREGNPVGEGFAPPRDDQSPPLKDESPFTPTFYDEDGELPRAHLHHKGGRIIGIHAEGDIHHIRLTLCLCLQHEERIIRELSGTHFFDIALEDVLQLLH